MENNMNINWYPGHMAKTKRQILEDVVVEILDARIPKSSQNPDIAEIVRNKKRIIILNKSDLADEKEYTAPDDCRNVSCAGGFLCAAGFG